MVLGVGVAESRAANSVVNSHGQAESDLRLFRFDLDDKAILASEAR